MPNQLDPQPNVQPNVMERFLQNWLLKPSANDEREMSMRAYREKNGPSFSPPITDDIPGYGKQIHDEQGIPHQTRFDIGQLIHKGPKLASDRSDLNDALGQSPETSFLQKPQPAATPQPKPKSTPKPTKQYPV